MSPAHLLCEEAIAAASVALAKGENWLAYNSASYYLKNVDLYFFKKGVEAQDFSRNNVSEYDCFKTIHFNSASELIRKVINSEAFEVDNQKTDLTTINTEIMNEKNFEFLRDQVKFTGFGDAVEKELKEKMQKQTSDFHIVHSAKFGNDTTTATLHFKKSDQSDMYFFNRYNLHLKQESGDSLDQTFYINKGNNITFKEAYNLMSGRAVNKDLSNKEGQIYNAWVQMDFKQTESNGNYKLKQFHQNYGFDLVSSVEKHPIKELANEQDKNRLVESLQKGNRQSVTFIQNGSEHKHFIEANPQFKTINVYDRNMERVINSQSKSEKHGQSESSTEKQDNKKEKQGQSGDEDTSETPKSSKKQRRKNGQSI